MGTFWSLAIVTGKLPAIVFCPTEVGSCDMLEGTAVPLAMPWMVRTEAEGVPADPTSGLPEAS
jgi:hypothetical protein